MMHDLSRHRGSAIIAIVEDTEHIRFNQMMTQWIQIKINNMATVEEFEDNKG